MNFTGGCAAPPFRPSITERFGGSKARNHANFGQPGNAVGTSTFGVVSSTRTVRGDLGSSRQIEFVLKLVF